MADKRQETLWVFRAQVGDRDALAALLRAVQEPLYRYIAGLVNDRAFAEDVLQEVFLCVYRKLCWLREPELFRPWCYRIATRETFRRLKGERRWSGQHCDQATLSAVEAPVAEERDPELLARLPDLLEQVSPASKTVLILHYLDDLSLEDVAGILDVPTGTVKSRLAYGLSILRRLLPNAEH